MNNLIEKYKDINQNLGKKSNEISQNEWYNNVIQKEIVSFSILMGAYTTYVFEALKLQTLKNTIPDSDINSEEIISWLKNSINPSYLFTLFKNLNIISRNDLETLIKSYENIFPDIYKKFEDINKRKNEPSEDKKEEIIEDYDSKGYNEYLKRKGNKT